MLNNHHEYECKVCGMKVADFVYTQRVGCGFCYLFFEKNYKTLLPNIHDGADKHVGKNSKNILYHFFMHIIDKKSQEEPEKKEDCEKLKDMLSDYF